MSTPVAPHADPQTSLGPGLEGSGLADGHFRDVVRLVRLLPPLIVSDAEIRMAVDRTPASAWRQLSYWVLGLTLLIIGLYAIQRTLQLRRELADEKAGKLRAEVTSAQQLSEAQTLLAPTDSAASAPLPESVPAPRPALAQAASSPNRLSSLTRLSSLSKGNTLRLML